FEFAPNSDAFGKGEYAYHFEASDGEIAVRLPESGELGFEVRFVPVILVPGILGTKLYNGDEEIWANYWDLITDSGDDFMNVLAMNYDGTTISNITTGDIIRDAPFTDVFTGLLDEFEDLGYEENTDLFVAPYDWRLDIRTSAQTLKQRIDNVVSQTNSENVNMVAHSMGGLLTKQYILDNGSSLMNKIIFVGTPHLGAPKAAKALLFGDSMGVPALDLARVKYIGQYMLSIYELLPSSFYLDQMGYYYYDSMQGVIYDYENTSQFLIDSGLSPILLADAENFHSDLMDNFDTTGLDIYNINGCNKPTITRIIKRGDEEYALDMLAGDETVPLNSSNALILDSNRVYYFNDAKHSTMPSANGIKELITQIITESTINLPDNATQDSSQCYIAGKLVSVHSPVNLHIYDSEGNHVGRGENGDIEYNISGVAYEEIGENKFVFLPESVGEEYRIELDGTDEGTFSLRVSKVENNEVIETAYYSDIPVNSSSEATITLSENVSSTVLQVDESGSGSFETVAVASVLNSEQSADTTKPITTISTTGGTSSAVFTLSATDDNSGILKTEYSLDNAQTWSNYSNSVIIKTIGETTVLYRSKDRAGNFEDYKSEIIRVASSAVILTPFFNAPSPLSNKAPEVLGIKIERSESQQYSNDDILGALKNADIDMLMDYLGKARNIEQEKSVAQKYG
ncbi:alpha/beta hydrolase, partial [Patescibacteria group bacterium]|nr:alpha/beta hydrolase [Patescibacteria group bacterium]